MKLSKLYEARPFNIKRQSDQGHGLVQAVGTKDPTRLEIPAQILSWMGVKSGVKLRVEVSAGRLILTAVDNPTNSEIEDMYGVRR